MALASENCACGTALHSSDVVNYASKDWNDMLASRTDDLMMVIKVAVPALHLDLSFTVPVNMERGSRSPVQQLVSRVSGVYPCATLLDGTEASDTELQRLARLHAEQKDFYQQLTTKFERMAQTIQQMKRDYYREVDHLRGQITMLKRDPAACVESVLFFDPEIYKIPSWEEMLERLDEKRMRREVLKESGGVITKCVPVYMLCQKCRGKFQALEEQVADKPSCCDAGSQTEDYSLLCETHVSRCQCSADAGFNSLGASKAFSSRSTDIADSESELASFFQQSLDSNSCDFARVDTYDADSLPLEAKPFRGSFAVSRVHAHDASVLSPRSAWIVNTISTSDRAGEHPRIVVGAEDRPSSSHDEKGALGQLNETREESLMSTSDCESETPLQPSEGYLMGQVLRRSNSSSESSHDDASISGSIPIDVWMRRHTTDGSIRPQAATVRREADATPPNTGSVLLEDLHHAVRVPRGRPRRRRVAASVSNASESSIDASSSSILAQRLAHSSADEEDGEKGFKERPSAHREGGAQSKSIKRNKENEKPCIDQSLSSYQQVPIVSMSPEFTPPDSKLIWMRKSRPSAVNTSQAYQHVEGVGSSDVIASVPDTVNLRLPRLPSPGSPDASPGLSARSWGFSARARGRPRRNSVPIGGFASQSID